MKIRCDKLYFYIYLCYNKYKLNKLLPKGKELVKVFPLVFRSIRFCIHLELSRVCLFE